MKNHVMKTNRAFKEFCVLGGLAYSVCGVAQERPNIIVFLVDDMGLMDTSVPFLADESGQPVRHPLNDWYHTPNMERLAKQGICFSTFYAQSVSSPSRASLLTGQNATRHRTTNWINAESNNRTPFGPPDWNWKGLTKDIPTMPKVLQQAGYKTIHIVKAHFGCMDSEGENPLNLGFDVNIAGSGIGHPGSYYGEWGYGHIKGSKARAVPDLEKYHGTDTFLSEALTIEAMKALDNAQKTDRPFFLYMAHYAIHTPIQPDMRFYQKYLDKGLPPVEAAYATLIEGMDKSLGDLMDYLDKNHLTQNTILIFMSDNGGLAAHTRAGQLHTQNYPLNSGKGSAYEGGVREPMIVRWPGVVTPSSKCGHYLMIEDFFPTILEMAGIDNYTTVQQRDGISFMPLLTGKGEMKNRDIYWHYPHSWGPSGPGLGATCSIRSGDWKLVYYFGDSKRELFNVPADISEQHDLAPEKPELVNELSQKLGNYLRSVNAQRPILRATRQPAPWPDEIKK